MTSLDALITETNSTAQYRRDYTYHEIVYAIATLRQLRKFAELQQRGACNMDLSKYTHWISVSFSANFQLSKGLCRGPEFSYHYDLS